MAARCVPVRSACSETDRRPHRCDFPGGRQRFRARPGAPNPSPRRLGHGHRPNRDTERASLRRRSEASLPRPPVHPPRGSEVCPQLPKETERRNTVFFQTGCRAKDGNRQACDRAPRPRHRPRPAPCFLGVRLTGDRGHRTRPAAADVSRTPVNKRRAWPTPRGGRGPSAGQTYFRRRGFRAPADGVSAWGTDLRGRRRCVQMRKLSSH